jgi:hypothetical protein
MLVHPPAGRTEQFRHVLRVGTGSDRLLESPIKRGIEVKPEAIDSEPKIFTEFL